jgi:hypothetical protein
MVRLDPDAVGDLHDSHLRMRRQQRRQRAFVVRRQVLDQHQDQPGIGGRGFQELGEGLEAAGRGADADDDHPVGQ